jgi:hypothetical protein
LLEFASGLNRNVCGRRRDLKFVGRTCQMIAALHALRSFGMAEIDNSDDADRGNWRPTEGAYELMQLEECGVDSDRIADALVPRFLYSIDTPALWFSSNEGLLKKFVHEVDPDTLKAFWRYIGTVVADIASDSIRLIGPTGNGGLVLRALTNEAREDYRGTEFCISLGGHSSKRRIPVIEIDAPASAGDLRNMIYPVVRWQ